MLDVVGNIIVHVCLFIIGNPLRKLNVKDKLHVNLINLIKIQIYS